MEQLRRVLREAEARLTAERATRAAAEAEKALAEGEAARMLADLREATEEAEIEAEASRQDRVESEAAIKAAEDEAAELRRRLQAEGAGLRKTLEQLREAEATRVAEAARAADRPTMVASRIDEVRLRRLQEAEQVRKSLGRLARLKAAWRGK
jgi:membrane protein involved in colicin uptake